VKLCVFHFFKRLFWKVIDRSLLIATFLDAKLMLASSRLIRISSEDLGNGNGDVGRILFIKGLQEADSGRYTCTAVYTSSQRLETSVNLTTIGLSLFPPLFLSLIFHLCFSYVFGICKFTNYLWLLT
jgi:hypothetical protein